MTEPVPVRNSDSPALTKGSSSAILSLALWKLDERLTTNLEGGLVSGKLGGSLGSGTMSQEITSIFPLDLSEKRGWKRRFQQ